MQLWRQFDNDVQTINRWYRASFYKNNGPHVKIKCNI